MRLSIVKVLAVALATTFGAHTAAAQSAAQSLAQQVRDGCNTELKSYCSKVTQGEGRVLACLYAHEDKLSGSCQFALYDASKRLERAVNALNYVASECRTDVNTLCPKVQAGEGRILQCLNDQSSKVSANCDRALKDTGMRKAAAPQSTKR